MRAGWILNYVSNEKSIHFQIRFLRLRIPVQPAGWWYFLLLIIPTINSSKIFPDARVVTLWWDRSCSCWTGARKRRPLETRCCTPQGIKSKKPINKFWSKQTFLTSFDSLKRAFEGVKILQANDFSDVSWSRSFKMLIYFTWLFSDWERRGGEGAEGAGPNLNMTQKLNKTQTQLQFLDSCKSKTFLH